MPGNQIIIVFNLVVNQLLLCISTSERMVENDRKHLKMSKIVPFSSCTREALDEKRVLFFSFSSVFDRFRPFERMRKHAFAGPNTQQTVYAQTR